MDLVPLPCEDDDSDTGRILVLVQEKFASGKKEKRLANELTDGNDYSMVKCILIIAMSLHH